MFKGNNYQHWVLVISGSGSNPANYTIHDPGPLRGQNHKLSDYSSWRFTWLSVYDGQGPCNLGEPPVVPDVPAASHPQPVLAAVQPDALPDNEWIDTAEAVDLTPSSTVTGSVVFYERTALTMTLQLTATSSAAEIVDMLIWTDTMTRAAWQPFSTFAYVPESNEIYVRFRDLYGNISPIVSEVPYTSSPIVAFDIYLPLIWR